MEDQADSALVSKGLGLMLGYNSKLVGLKRGSDELEERQKVSPKPIKMRDLDPVFRSEAEVYAQNSRTLTGKEGSKQFQFSKAVSQVTDIPNTERTIGENLSASASAVSLTLDLNAETHVAMNESSDNIPECEEKFDKICSQESHCVTSKGIGLDLNAEDVSSSINHKSIHHKHVESLKPKDVSECGSSIGSLGENDSLRVWKEMKQNGFLSSSHGGITMQNSLMQSSHGGIPVLKQRGRKSKIDVFKKKMDLAKKEQVDRFTKIAAPSGLLNGLNPGIINHVRNRKQVHSIIEALVKSEKVENLNSDSKQASHTKNGGKDDCTKKDHVNMDDSGLNQLSSYHEDGPSNTTSISQKARDYLVPMHKSFSSILEERSGDGDSSMENPACEDDTLALKLSSLTRAPENASSLSNEESANITSASSLSVKAATVASQWLGLLQQDIKGRLSALQRSKEKVHAAVTTELPFLISKEFSSNQENDPNIIRNSVDGFSYDAAAEMHQVRWSALFDQMDRALSEEEKQLESWLNQIEGMQIHCEKGLQHMQWNVLYNLPHLRASENYMRSGMGDSFERELAVGAAAASIYSTCDFMLSRENVPCS